VNYGVEIFGDRCSLLIIRDIAFAGKKTYGEFLKPEEGIATNVLASRLAFLEEQGILSSRLPGGLRLSGFQSIQESGPGMPNKKRRTRRGTAHVERS
jgi:hypothetical protein